MYTKTLGVLEDYSQEAFYSKLNNFSAEKQRVNQLFKQAEELG